MSSDLNAKSDAFSGGPEPVRLTAAPASLLQGLEQIRERFHQHLDGIEALARERSQRSARELHGKEEQLRHQALELEQARQQFQADVTQWEQERQAMIVQLEHDRRLLAEAWERLEREQVQTNTTTRSAAPAQPQAPRPVALPVSAGRRDQPVAEEILRQFQSLRRDVRRTAEAACAV